MISAMICTNKWSVAFPIDDAFQRFSSMTISRNPPCYTAVILKHPQSLSINLNARRLRVNFAKTIERWDECVRFLALDRQGLRHGNGTTRPLKKNDSNECLTGEWKELRCDRLFIHRSLIDPSPKTARSISRFTQELESRVLATNSKSLANSSSLSQTRQFLLNNPTENETIPNSSDTIYSNVAVSLRPKKKDFSIDDEADLIEHDLLDLVEQEQQKDEQIHHPPALPAKLRPPISDSTWFDIPIEPTMKLNHPSTTCSLFTFSPSSSRNIFI